MAGRRKSRRGKTAGPVKGGGAGGTRVREVAPALPTSGQILGVLVNGLGIRHPKLGTKTARRYFSGQLKDRVKESSRARILEGIAEVLTESGLVPAQAVTDGGPSTVSALASIIDWHATSWDRLRAHLLPRMPRVLPPHLADVWLTYIRLAAIDLALRVAAHIHLSGASPDVLDFLGWSTGKRRGAYLNRKRSEAGISLLPFAEASRVSSNTVEAWMYKGARPTDENLSRIAGILATESDPSERDRILLELRRLYWTSDVAGILERYLGAEVVSDLLGRMQTYVSRACQLIDDRIAPEARCEVLEELATLGVHSEFADSLLSALATQELDDDWRRDLEAAGSDWIVRVLTVNLQVHQSEVESLIRETNGQVLKNWDVNSPKAYAHYERSTQLQMEGRIEEAMAEVARAAELDPLDPANHFTLGSVKGGIGADTGNATLIREGLESCWLAVTLDPNWILPWTEIGWILLKTGRSREAVEHLRAVGPECGPLDARYYTALATALHQLGRYDAALAGLESAHKLDPEDPTVSSAAAMTALLVGDRARSNRHAKTARHLGASTWFTAAFELLKSTRTETSSISTSPDNDHGIAGSEFSAGRSPTRSIAHIRKALAHFEVGDGGRAIEELDTLIRIEPGNADAYLLRGIVRGYSGLYDNVIADMSEVLRIDPGNATAYHYRGMAYGERDEFDEAIADMNAVIQLEPAHGDAHRVRGDCRRYRAEYDLAIADFDAALGIDPDDAASYRSRGAARRMKLEFERAISDYDAALRLEPEDPLTHRFRGDAYLGSRDFSRAIADFDITLGIDAADDIAYRQRATARLFSGEFELAIADFNTAIDRDPHSADAHHGRGLARDLTGDREGAETDFQRARELGYDDSS